MFSPRIGLQPLAELCRKVATGLEAGVDVRKVWLREAEHAHGRGRPILAQISTSINAGTSVAESVQQAGDFFPSLFGEMVEVGEKSGHLAEVFRQLSEHFDHQVQMRRQFLHAIAWPVAQFVIALSVVGFLIWVVGFIAEMTNSPPLDLLGLGLIGNRGLAIYLSILAAVAAAGVVAYLKLRSGKLWIKPVQRIAMQVPKLGPAMNTLALARLAWALQVTLDAGMDLIPAFRLALAASRSPRYSDHIEAVCSGLRSGREVYEILADTGAFPAEFLDAVQVGERSGRLVETLAVVSRQYQDEARSALGQITFIASKLVWGMVAILIIVLIFRLFNVYVGQINAAVKMK